jgi:GxxExxY protein
MRKDQKGLPHSDISEKIIGCCFDVINELGFGFLENVYKNALFIVMQQKGLHVIAEQPFDIIFRNQKIGKYVADLIVNDLIIVELKCCKTLLSEHKAQVINYLKAADLPVGLLVNFGSQKLEYKRLHHPDNFFEKQEFEEDFSPFVLSEQQNETKNAYPKYL